MAEATEAPGGSSIAYVASPSAVTDAEVGAEPSTAVLSSDLGSGAPGRVETITVRETAAISAARCARIRAEEGPGSAASVGATRGGVAGGRAVSGAGRAVGEVSREGASCADLVRGLTLASPATPGASESASAAPRAAARRRVVAGLVMLVSRSARSWREVPFPSSVYATGRPFRHRSPSALVPRGCVYVVEYGGQAMEEQNLTNALGPGPDCLSIERLGRYADGILSDDERRADESHIAACANCQAELALLHAFAAVDRARRRSGGRARGRRAAATSRSGDLCSGSSDAHVVATMVLARPAASRAHAGSCLAGCCRRLLPDQSSGAAASDRCRFRLGGDALDGHHRAGTGRRSDSGARPAAVATGRAARRDTTCGSWKSIATRSGRATPTDAAIDLPAAVQAQIGPAKTLVWQVTAYGASNTPIAESDPQRFRLAR